MSDVLNRAIIQGAPMHHHTDQIPQAVDAVKIAGLMLGAYGAILSTFNFFSAHYGRLIVEFQNAASGSGNLGTIRLLCIGRPRFVETVKILDVGDKILFEADVMETLSKGEARKILVPERSLRKEGTYQIAVNSERRIFLKHFSL
jgi:hypothetical protein